MKSKAREPHPIDAILPTLHDVRVVVEIGCHRMEDTAFLRATFPFAKIFAFDPDPRNAAYIRANDLQRRLLVRFEELAIGLNNEVCDFYLSTNFSADPVKEWTASSSLRKPKELSATHAELARTGRIPHVFAERPVKVACVRLDTFFADIGYTDPIDLMWCDAQGAEDMIIQGAPETLKRTRWLMLEHNTNGQYVAAPDRSVLEFLLPGWEIVHVWPYDMLLKNPNEAL